MFGFLGQTTEDGNRCLESLRASYDSAKKALQGNSSLYQKYESKLFSVMLAINSLVGMKNQIGVGSVGSVTVESYNREACDALVRFGSDLAAMRADAGISETFSVAALPTAPVSSTVALEEANAPKPAIFTVSAPVAGETFDPVQYARDQAAAEEYVRQIKSSTNPAGEITTPRSGREPVWLTPSNVSGVVNAIFGGVAQFQKAQIEAELLRLSAMGKPAQLPVPLAQQAKGTTWWPYVLIGAGILVLGGILYAGRGRKKSDVAPSVVTSIPKALPGPTPMKLLPAPK